MQEAWLANDVAQCGYCQHLQPHPRPIKQGATRM